ncbi:MAG: DnaJ domain-containing protein [Blastocatellia bacterium]|nr:DnaJ domain-containing protein [Blastocatellia bacterium]
MSTQLGESPYKVLGVERNATEADIKQAYFKLVREHPPERDPEGFKRIRAAYEKLRADRERAETDLFLIEDQPETLDLSSIRRPAVEPPEITPDLIGRDLIALESLLLLEELRLDSKRMN